MLLAFAKAGERNAVTVRDADQAFAGLNDVDVFSRGARRAAAPDAPAARRSRRSAE